MASHSQFHSRSLTDSDISHNVASSSTTSSSSTPSSTLKNRRASVRQPRRPSMMLLSPTSESGLSFEESGNQFRQTLDEKHDHHNDGEEIAISSTGETAGKNITPFLSKHIPITYNPVSTKMASMQDTEDQVTNNTTYCNRHRPDRKCRRQADGPSMEQLQNELSSLSHSDRSAISHVWSVFSAAPGKQRELILQGILSVACFNQLSFIAAQVRDLIKIDFISLLPTEIALQILSNLDTASLCKSAQVSRTWNQLADSDVPWRSMCSQHIGRKCTKCGWGLPILERKRLRQERKKQLLGQSHFQNSEIKLSPNAGDALAHPTGGAKRPRDEELVESDLSQKRPRSSQLTRRPWKAVYRDQYRIGAAWRKGNASIKILKGHTNGVTCLQVGDNVLGDDILATGSYDTTIKMWSREGKMIREFNGHTSGVRCLLFDRHQLISGGLDHKINVWNIKSGELVRTLEGPRGGVLSVSCEGNYLAAGSMDKCIYIWDIATRRSSRICSAATDFINSVVVDAPSRTVLASSDDCTVRLWNLDTKRVVQTFTGHVGPVQQAIYMPADFEFDPNDIEKVDNDCDTDTDYDREDGSQSPNSQTGIKLHRSTSPPPSLDNTSLFPSEPDRPNPPSYILTCGLDATLRLWHVASGRCLRTFFGHLEGIWSARADALRIASVGEDGMVKLWSPSNGSCEKTFTGHAAPVTCVALTPDRLYTAGEDCTVRVMTFGAEEDDEKEADAECADVLSPEHAT